MENWHLKEKEERTFANKLADKVAALMGSWRFIIAQTVFIIIWISLNIVGFIQHWDVYPYILLNLLFSTQASYAAPIIMMAQNRQNDRDRVKADSDYETNKMAKLEIEQLISKLDRLEIDKLDKIMAKLDIKEPVISNEDPITVFEAASKEYPIYNDHSERVAFEKGAMWQRRQLKNK